MSFHLLSPFFFFLFAKYLIILTLVGKETGAFTVKGIFDPNSWGQFLGGTHSKNGRDVGFKDSASIVGQALRTNPSCVAVMMCSNVTLPERDSTLDGARAFVNNSTTPASLVAVAPTSISHTNRNKSTLVGRSLLTATSTSGGGDCYTAPFVRCNESDPWTPIWNLHVHSKQTEKFRSVSCRC